jgi:hypothetical protein
LPQHIAGEGAPTGEGDGGAGPDRSASTALGSIPSVVDSVGKVDHTAETKAGEKASPEKSAPNDRPTGLELVALPGVAER